MDRHHTLAAARKSLDDGRRAAGGGDLDRALGQFSEVVARIAALKEASRPESWSVHDERLLVQAYFLRANSLASTGDLRGAERDFAAAESILHAVRAVTYDGSWVSEDEVHLASVYMRRGGVRMMNDEPDLAIRDYDASISLLEMLKTDEQRAGWTDDCDLRLALAYFSRGNFHDTNGSATNAIHDLNQAVSILQSSKGKAPGNYSGKLSTARPARAIWMATRGLYPWLAMDWR